MLLLCRMAVRGLSTCEPTLLLNLPPTGHIFLLCNSQTKDICMISQNMEAMHCSLCRDSRATEVQLCGGFSLETPWSVL